MRDDGCEKTSGHARDMIVSSVTRGPEVDQARLEYTKVQRFEERVCVRESVCAVVRAVVERRGRGRQRERGARIGRRGTGLLRPNGVGAGQSWEEDIWEASGMVKVVDTL